MVFFSNASNIAQIDANGTIQDVFLYDAQANGGAGGVSLISRAFGTTGTTGNSVSGFNAMSSDGRYTVFFSSASDIAQTDTNGQQDLFLYDAQANGGAGGVSLISRAFGTTSTTGSGGNSGFNAISSDGRYTVFFSNSSNIAQIDTNGQQDLFLYDAQANGGAGGVSLITRAFGTTGTAGAGGFSSFNTLTSDGRYTVFGSNATNIAQTDTNGTTDLFLYDAQANGGAGGVSLIDRAFGTTGTTANNGVNQFLLSSNGRYAVFTSNATNIAQTDANGFGDVFLYDAQAQWRRRRRVADQPCLRYYRNGGE